MYSICPDCIPDPRDYVHVFLSLTLPPFNSHVSDILLALITVGIVAFMIRAS
jgi:hypothetical protein